LKNSPINTAWAILVLVLAASSVQATVYQEPDEIVRRFTLPAKARVEVSAISGSVDLKAIDGETAIVQVERTAPSRAELDCNKIVFEQAPGTLVIKSKTVGCNNIDKVSYRVLLSVPRTVDVSLHGISGPLDIGEIEGQLTISGNSGNINVAQWGSGSIISGNSGTIAIKIRQLDAAGVELNGNSGLIKLHIADELNVDVKVSALSGSVSSELPNVKFKKRGPADYYARIGSGGPTINVEGNSGSVLLSRYQE